MSSRWRVIATCLMACLVTLTAIGGAVADDASVGAGDDGWVEGVYNSGDQPGRKSTKKPKANRTPDRPAKGQPAQAADPCATDLGCAGMSAALDPAAAEQYVRQLIVELQLPTPTPQFGPDPSVNEWNMLAVGFPIWLWTEGPTTVTASESAFGHTFTLRATYRSTTFTMGDGHAKQCTKTTPYRSSVTPGAKSPTCGYTYQQAAPKGSYTVTATTHWDVAWSVAGYSGTLPGTHSASRDLPIGELHAIRVK
jgi:hypothetical protein